MRRTPAAAYAWSRATLSFFLAGLCLFLVVAILVDHQLWGPETDREPPVIHVDQRSGSDRTGE